jgi:hypothetical protein
MFESKVGSIVLMYRKLIKELAGINHGTAAPCVHKVQDMRYPGQKHGIAADARVLSTS